MKENKKKGLLLMTFAVIVFLGLQFVNPAYLGVTGPGGCQYGGVTSLVTSASVYNTGAAASASGGIGGSCSAQGDSVYWALTSSNGTIISTSTTAASSGNVFSFDFVAPSAAGSYGVEASLCSGLSNANCTANTSLEGVASATFETLTQSGLSTYTATVNFDNSAGNYINGVTVYLYYVESSTQTVLAGSGSTGAQGVNGAVTFQGLLAGSYQVSWFPTVGPYANGAQSGIAIGAGKSNLFTVTLPTTTVTTTSTSQSTTVVTSTSQSTSTTVVTSGGSTSTSTTVVTYTNYSTCTSNSQTSCPNGSSLSSFLPAPVVQYGVPLLIFGLGLVVYRRK